MNRPLIIAHRGDIEHAPENTFAAFESAIHKGADGIELDVHLTADNEVVVHHDFYLDRTTNGTGFISNQSLAVLKKLDVGSWFDKQFSQERMPTLSEVFELGKGKIRFEIEFKSPSERLIQKVLSLIKNHNLMGDIELTSWHVPLLYQIKLLSPGANVGMIFHPLEDWMEASVGIMHAIQLMKMSNAQVAHLYPNMLDEQTIERVQGAGFKISASVNEQVTEIDRFARSGVHQLSTNFLDKTLAVSFGSS